MGGEENRYTVINHNNSIKGYIQHGNIEMLEWVIKNGCTVNINSYVDAIKNGHLHIVIWLSI